MKIALKCEKPLRPGDNSRQNRIYLCPNFEWLPQGTQDSIYSSLWNKQGYRAWLYP